MAAALRQLEPFVKSGDHLRTGRDLSGIGLRSREILGNWLLCAVANHHAGHERFLFSSDPTGGDGLLHDLDRGSMHATEHVIVMGGHRKSTATSNLILEAVRKKMGKGGKPYASGKTLVVFIDGGDQIWYPNEVARMLPGDRFFEAVWAIALNAMRGQSYIYGVTRLDVRLPAPCWLVEINSSFSSWSVTPVQ